MPARVAFDPLEEEAGAQLGRWRQSVNYLLRKGKKIEEEKKKKRVSIVDLAFIDIHTSKNGTPQRDVQTPLRRARDACVREGKATITGS